MDNTLGGRLKLLRVNRGLTQMQLAALAGTTAAEVSRVEKSQRPGVQAVLVARLATALGSTADYLLGMTADAAPPEGRMEAAVDDPARLLRLQRLIDRLVKLPRPSQDRIIDAMLLLLEVGEVANNVGRIAPGDVFPEVQSSNGPDGGRPGEADR